MNRKGQMAGVGAVVILFIAIIVGITVVFQGSSPSIGILTQTTTVSNSTQTFPAAGFNLTLNGQAAHDVIVTNVTSGAVVPSTNYTVSNYFLSNGELQARFTAKTGPYNSQSVNISYTSEPFGYQTSSGNRAVVSLILIMSALSLIVFMIARGGIADFFRSFR